MKDKPKKKRRYSQDGDICPTCGKTIAEGTVGLISSGFNSDFCACNQIASEGLIAGASGSGGKDSKRRKGSDKDNKDGDKDGRGNKDQRDSLASFCPICGQEIRTGRALASITGFLFQDTNCECMQGSLMGENMAERFFKLREAEADKNFASITQNMQETTAQSSNPKGAPVKSSQNKGAADASSVPISIDLLPGATVGGVYRITELLGKGGMGEVYLAQHKGLAKNCALKVIPPNKVTDHSWQRFQNEAKTIASLEHVNLVKVTDLGLHQGCLPFYAMEYLDGESLHDKLKTRGRLPLNTTIDIFLQVCDGVNHAHRRGIVHRDLKPANFMLIQNGAKFLVKILDFGLVKLTQNDRAGQSITRVGEVFGTPLYMSPEQCVGGKIDSRSDVYSIGCALFETLTGRVPFVEDSAIQTIAAHQSLEPPTLSSIMGPGLFPQSMENVIAKLLRKDPGERYQNLLELKADLERVSRGEEVEPYNSTKLGRARFISVEEELPEISREMPDFMRVPRKRKLRREAIMVLSVLFALIVAGGIGSWYVVAEDAKHAAPKAKFSMQVEPSIARHTSHAGTGSGTGSGTDGEPGTSTTIDTRSGTTSGESSTGSTDNEQGEKNSDADADNQDPEDRPPPLSYKDTTPFSKIVSKDGKKYRVFHFPDDVLIGRIHVENSEGVKAVGEKIFPANAWISLQPDIEISRYPNYLKRFRPGDIYSLSMHRYAVEQGSCDEMLQAWTNVPDVHMLDLRGSSDLSSKSTALFNKFPKLEVLLLGRVHYDPVALAKIPAIKNMREMIVSGAGDTVSLFKALAGSKHAERLIIVGAKLTEGEADDLASLPNLKELAVDRLKVKDEDAACRILAKLAKCKKLEELSIKHMILTPKIVPVLKAFPRLHRLRYDIVGNTTSMTEQKRLMDSLKPMEWGPPYLDSGKIPH